MKPIRSDGIDLAHGPRPEMPCEARRLEGDRPRPLTIHWGRGMCGSLGGWGALSPTRNRDQRSKARTVRSRAIKKMLCWPYASKAATISTEQGSAICHPPDNFGALAGLRNDLIPRSDVTGSSAQQVFPMSVSYALVAVLLVLLVLACFASVGFAGYGFVKLVTLAI
jgi:hypothetical protein